MASDVIAIDGPAASGKSTVARLLAQRLAIPYINTGNMYRAITLTAMRQGVSSVEDCTEEALEPILAALDLEYVKTESGAFVLLVNGRSEEETLRSPDVAALASPIAALGNVRNFLKTKQRAMARLGRIVMEGRDIGTEIFPDAKFKFFLTATPEERARRRLAQKGETTTGATLASVAAAIAERDRADSTRAIAPLRPATDAEVIDSTGFEAEQVVELLARKVLTNVS